MIDYLDEDVAYLLGMLIARGTISEHRDIFTITIEIPFSNIYTDDPPYSKDGDRNALLVSIDKITNRLHELIGFLPRKSPGEKSVSIIIEINRKTILIRDLLMFLGDARDYSNFLIPDQIFSEATIEEKREFMRGFADVNGKVRRSNRYISGENRIYLDILNPNWRLPIQICELLQNHLNIPVQTLTWGHPNIRQSNQPETTWMRREHQIKVFNNDFVQIGFYLDHKNQKNLEFAEENRKMGVEGKPCIPMIKSNRKVRIKGSHPDEDNVDLPIELRGTHYDSYWQICRDLGCKEFKDQKTIFDYSKKIPYLCLKCKHFNSSDKKCYVDVGSGEIYDTLDPEDECFEPK
ncbi:MAG: hypothetical protein ACFFDH_23775 [Promethearchaeota archaeon]